MSELTQGLFEIKLNPFHDSIRTRTCRIMGCSIYSVQKRLKDKLIAYKVGYWDETPVTENDYSQMKTYRSNRHGSIIHTFKVPSKVYSKTELLFLCEKHFTGIAQNDYIPRTLQEEITLLKGKEAFRQSPSRLLPTKYIKVWDLLHKSLYQSIDGKYPIFIENTLSFKGNFFDGVTPVYPWEFLPTDNLQISTPWINPIYRLAIQHLDKQETIDFCNETFVG